MPASPPKEAKPRGNWGSLLFVVIVMLATIAFLLLAPIGRLGVAILAGGLLFPTLIAVHYFVWGRWLQQALEQSGTETEDDDS